MHATYNTVFYCARPLVLSPALDSKQRRNGWDKRLSLPPALINNVVILKVAVD